MDADVALGALNAASVYATGHVAVAYARWQHAHRKREGTVWWRHLGLLPLAVAVAMSVELLEGLYYGVARVLRHYSIVNLWQVTGPTALLNTLVLVGMMFMLVPYYIGLGYSRQRVMRELGQVAAICLIVFLVVAAALT